MSHQWTCRLPPELVVNQESGDPPTAVDHGPNTVQTAAVTTRVATGEPLDSLRSLVAFSRHRVRLCSWPSAVLEDRGRRSKSRRRSRHDNGEVPSTKGRRLVKLVFYAVFPQRTVNGRTASSHSDPRPRGVLQEDRRRARGPRAPRSGRAAGRRMAGRNVRLARARRDQAANQRNRQEERAMTGGERNEKRDTVGSHRASIIRRIAYISRRRVSPASN